MYKIAVMGDYASIYGFGALGLELYPETDPEKAAKTLKKLAEADTAVVYLTEALAAGMAETLEKYRAQALPAIILIPGAAGNTGQGSAEVHRSVERAVGSDIYAGKEKE